VIERTDRLLVVEPDNLTLWSVVTFLRRWFTVASAESYDQAEDLLRSVPVGGLVLSDQLPGWALESLLRFAVDQNAGIRVILLVDNACDARLAPLPVVRLEKPFQLSELARCLGVPEAELVS
jgi:DNA-binding NtrC family response regulator